jgi:hypothetical protein
MTYYDLMAAFGVASTLLIGVGLLFMGCLTERRDSYIGLGIVTLGVAGLVGAALAMMPPGSF